MGLECPYPVPRTTTSLGGEPVDPAAAPQLSEDRSLPPQGYELRVADGEVHVRYRDLDGQRYALDSWQQLARQHAAGVPPQLIRDWPDFAFRGYMLDISRDRVPTRETLRRIVELLALCRINHFELYTEHTFAYRDHEAVWRSASPLTGDDLHWLDRLCASHGIELSANQNCFGHMERWLRHPSYRERAEAPDGWLSQWGGRMPAAVLAPTPDNAEFAVGLVRELLEHVASRRVNIGCDETFELGSGSSKQAVEAHGRGRVYLEHLKRLIAPLAADGCEVMFWGDIVREHPELVAELNKEQTTALVWHYEAPLDPASIPEPLLQVGAEFGITADVLRGFGGQMSAFVDTGFPHWVCPGTSSWNSLVGRLANAKLNLLDAAEHGARSGARGYMITDWGDNGHLQPPSISFAPLVYGAGISWCLASNRDLDVADILDRRVFDDRARELGGTLELIGNVFSGTGKVGFNGSPLFTALIKRGLLGALGATDARGLQRVIGELEDAEQRLARAAPACSDGPIVVRELRQAVRLARHGAWRMAEEAGAPCPDAAELRRDLQQLTVEQRACWLMRSRPGGLADSLARLDRP